MTPERKRIENLRLHFAITPEEWDGLLAAQGGACAGCGRTEEETGRRLAVDHDHETGRNRGLLCFRCNTILGKVSEDPKVLRTLAEYLERNKLS